MNAPLRLPAEPLKLPGPSGLAAGVFERELPRLASALRRALPFLTRRAVPVSLGYARAVTLLELQDSLERPSHRVSLALANNGGRGALFFDAKALALLLDGVLGGDGRAPPRLSPAGLTAPQGALVARTAEGVVKALSEVLAARAGVHFDALPWSPEPPREDTPVVAAAFDLGAEPSPARVVLALPGESLEPRARAPAPEADLRVARALDAVDLELVVELARVSMRLGDVLALRPGDTLPLDVPVGESVSVRADERTLFRGKPTSLLGRIAVRIESRHDR